MPSSFAAVFILPPVGAPAVGYVVLSLELLALAVAYQANLWG